MIVAISVKRMGDSEGSGVKATLSWWKLAALTNDNIIAYWTLDGFWRRR